MQHTKSIATLKIRMLKQDHCIVKIRPLKNRAGKHLNDVVNEKNL